MSTAPASCGARACCDADCCLVDVDGDGICDADDLCVAPAAAAKPKFVVSRLSTPPGDDRIAITGRATLPHPFNPPLDPLTNGIRLVVADTLDPLMDLTIPGGAYQPTPGKGHGWKLRGTRWTYTDRNPFGINKVVIDDKSASLPGLVTLKVAGKNSDYQVPLANLPLRATLILDTPVAAGGQCVEFTFPGLPGPACASSTGGLGSIKCK